MTPHHILEREQWVPTPLEDVFEFFSSARNLEFLTPGWLKFRILTLPISVHSGTKILYRIHWHGIPLHWTTEITHWDPPYEFVDMQISGPYKLWHHTHRFEAVDGGTQITDIVQYALPFGPFGQLAHALWVKRDVERIFDYRRERIVEMFGESRAA